MFTRSQLANVARHAHALEQGQGQGYTQYATYAPRGRYVVGGLLPSRLYPIREAVPAIKADALKDSRTPLGMAAHTLGCWEDDGTVYVDFGTTTDDREHALCMAVDRGELAIYDTVTGECITVG